MPKCSQIGVLNDAAVRCAEVDLSIFGLTQKIFMGGLAKAVFPNYEDVSESELNGESRLNLKWESALFYGSHPLLGPIIAELNPDFANSGLQSSVVPINDEVAPENQFFPALNENSFDFHFKIPRFNVVYKSSEPLINRAIIESIPPWNVEYKLIEQITYRASKKDSGLLSNLSPSVKLESCRVKLMELKNIDVNLEIEEQTESDISFKATVINRTEEEIVKASWLIWPRPEDLRGTSIGSTRLMRNKERIIRFKTPRDIFYLERWLAISIAQPFETNAAQAVKFPAL